MGDGSVSATSKGARPINPNKPRATAWEIANLRKQPPTPTGAEFARARERRRLARRTEVQR